MSARILDLKPDNTLTEWAVQYGAGPGFVADIVAPVMNVAAQDFKFPVYVADQLDLDEKMEVGPGDKPNTTNFRLPSFTSASTVRRALDSQLTREVQLVGIGPLAKERAHVAKITHRLKLRIEKSIKALLDAATTYQTTPSTKWDAGGNTIEKDIDTAKEAFEVRSGLMPTHLIMPRAIANVVKRDSNIRALRKFTNDNLLLDGEIPSTIFGLKVLIPGAIENTANPGLSQSLARVWATDTCYMVHVNPSLTSDGESATSIAQFRWAEWGSPFAAFSWDDAHLSRRVRWISVDVHQTEKVVAPLAIQQLNDCLT